MTKFEGHKDSTGLKICVMSGFVTLMSVAAHNRSSRVPWFLFHWNVR